MYEQIIKFITKKEIYGIIFIVCLGFIIYKFSGVIFEKIINSGKNELEKKRRNTIVKLFQNIFKYIVFVIILLLILELYGVNTKSLIAGLGVLGAVLGLALQDTIKDLINGITIILENFYIVGDTITYGTFTGEVIDLGLKTTKIKALSGEVMIVSNRNIFEIINLSQQTACFTLLIPTAYKHKMEQIETVMQEAIDQIKKLKEIKNAVFLGIETLDNSSISYGVRVWCKRGTQWDMKRVVLKIIKAKYDEHNIEVPYPQIEVHNGKKV